MKIKMYEVYDICVMPKGNKELNFFAHQKLF